MGADEVKDQGFYVRCWDAAPELVHRQSHEVSLMARTFVVSNRGHISGEVDDRAVPSFGGVPKTRELGLGLKISRGVGGQPIDEIPPRVPGSWVAAEEVKEVTPAGVRHRIHRYAGAPQTLDALTEEETRPAKIRAALSNHKIDETGAPTADEKMDDRRRHSGTRVAFLAGPRRLRQGFPQCVHALASDSLRWAVGVGVDKNRSWQDALEIGGTIDKGLTCFVGDAIESIDKTQPNLLGRGLRVLVCTPNHNECIGLSAPEL